jgi:hypothetical protein
MRSFILSTTELTTKCLDELEFGVSTVPWCLLAASSRIFPGVLYMLKFLLSFDDDPHFIQCSAINMGQTSRLVSVGALVGALCTRFAFAGGSKFYWDGYLGSGYDVFVGNAKSTSGADPGYRSAVYNVTAATDNNMPYGIISDTCAQCTAAFSVTEHSGPLSYQTALQSTYSTNFQGWEASFTGSADFKDVYSQTLGNHDVVIETAAECCVYTAHFDTSIFPLFSSDFILMIKLMPTKYDDSTKAWFDIFIQVYGTHVVTKADFGGRSGQRSDLSGTSWTLLSTSNLVLQDTAKFSAIKATASAVLMSGNEAEQAQVFASYSRSQSQFSVGAPYPADGTTASWSSACQENAAPVGDINLQTLSDLLIPQNFPLDFQLASKQRALSQALSSYCLGLIGQGVIFSCDTLGPDPTYPSKSAFGGIFIQTDGCSGGGYFNPYTGHNYCGSGYQAFAVGRSLNPEGKCGEVTYLCLSSTTDAQDSFGGTFQRADLEAENNRNNPMTDAISCPSGYVEYAYGRVLTAEPHQWGASQFYCFNPQVALGASELGGFYQAEDFVMNDVVNNYYTQSTSCPSGYRAFPVGRQYAPEDKVGASQFVCLNNVFVLTPKSSFGGMYSQTDGCSGGYANPYTGQQNCPYGFNAYGIGRSLEPEGKCGQVTYLCLSTATDPQNAFEGAFQVADLEASNNRNNPVTDDPSCPANFEKIAFGRVLTAEPHQWGASQFYCYNPATPLGSTALGGFFQTVDLGHTADIINNHYTQATSCPRGYTAFPLARQYAPEDKVGASQFMCLSSTNIY